MKTNKNKIVITGASIVNPLGNSYEEILNNIEKKNKGNFQKDECLGIYLGRVKNSDLLTDNERKKMDKFTALAIEAASHLNLSENDKKNSSIFMGTCLGGIDFAEREIKVFYEQGARRVSPYLAISMFYSSNVAQIAIHNDIHGQLSVFCDGALASASAICWAFENIRNNMTSTVIAGGSEAPTTELGIKAFSDMGMLRNSKKIISDACGLLLLESERTARNSKKEILAEITGYGEGQMNGNLEENIRMTIVSCLESSEASIKDIDAVVLNDDNIFKNSEYEIQAVKSLFLNTNVLYVSMKPLIGYSFGAGLAQEIVLMLGCLIREKIPEPFVYNSKILTSPKGTFNMRKNTLNVLFINIDIYGKSIALIVRREKS